MPEPESVTEHEGEPPGRVQASPIERLPSKHPMSVREIVERLDAGWQKFRSAAVAFPGERMNEHLDGGWTRKQMLAHITAWHELTNERLAKMVATGKSVPLNDDEDTINARVARQAVGRTAGEVLKDMELSFNRLRRQVDRLTDEQLAADDAWAAQIIAGNTYEHYEEHAADVYQPPAHDARGSGRR
jgi:Protein of unknown function (DUF1706)